MNRNNEYNEKEEGINRLIISYTKYDGSPGKFDTKDTKLISIIHRLTIGQMKIVELHGGTAELREHFLDMYKKAVVEEEDKNSRLRSQEGIVDRKIVIDTSTSSDRMYLENRKRMMDLMKGREIWKKHLKSGHSHDEAYLRMAADKLFLDEDAVKQAFERCLEGPLEQLSDDVWSNMTNTDSYDERTRKEAEQQINEMGGNAMDVLHKVDNGKFLPPPIVLFRKDEPPYLVVGNEVLLASRALGMTPHILAVRL